MLSSSSSKTKMSHRKAHSQGSIPFSWEAKPGVCKTPNNIERSLQVSAINQTIHDSALSLTHLENKIPLPPCPSQHSPPFHRSTSSKVFKWQQDPFLIAYKECTKSERNDRLSTKNKKGVVGSNCSMRRGKYYIFSCRDASDVRDDSYLKILQLPRLPSHTNRSLTLQDMNTNQAPTTNHAYDFLY
ncbi:unnamed protein product [Lupinus luteus]|uniref:Uncharacterized protein n=1 Tax=Lupinus luteus TaxID=3873 RepID=A0AAV1YAR5_LUPLU